MTHRPSCKACSMTAAATPQTSAGAWQQRRVENRVVAVQCLQLLQFLDQAAVWPFYVGQGCHPCAGALCSSDSRQWQHPPCPCTRPLAPLILAPLTLGPRPRRREVFWESTGLRGQSTLREVDLETGEVRRTGPGCVQGLVHGGSAPSACAWRALRRSKRCLVACMVLYCSPAGSALQGASGARLWGGCDADGGQVRWAGAGQVRWEVRWAEGGQVRWAAGAAAPHGMGF